MSTNGASNKLDQALAAIPKNLRERLLRNYAAVKSNSLQPHPDTVGHQAGKLAEVLIRVLQHLLTGASTPLSVGLGNNFKGECERLEQVPKTAGAEGLRILMPRALAFLFTLRNKRDFGHVGGEVDANAIDALTAIRLADWCMCELVRVCHSVPLEDAELICNSISERQLPMTWTVLGRKRILDPTLTYRDQTLLLLYAEIDSAVPCEDLFEWTEHSQRSHFNRDVLSKLHKARLIEWDRDTDMAILSPTGIREVEVAVIPRVKVLK
jgi:hypothetical protein